MEFGFGLPTRGPMATPHSLATLAHKGEELGFAIISVSDHLIIPREIVQVPEVGGLHHRYLRQAA